MWRPPAKSAESDNRLRIQMLLQVHGDHLPDHLDLGVHSNLGISHIFSGQLDDADDRMAEAVEGDAIPFG